MPRVRRSRAPRAQFSLRIRADSDGPEGRALTRLRCVLYFFYVGSVIVYDVFVGGLYVLVWSVLGIMLLLFPILYIDHVFLIVVYKSYMTCVRFLLSLWFVD